MHTWIYIHIVQICFDCGNIICGIGPSSVNDGRLAQNCGQNWGNGEGPQYHAHATTHATTGETCYLSKTVAKTGETEMAPEWRNRTPQYHIIIIILYSNDEDRSESSQPSQVGIESEIGMVNFCC